MTRVLQTEGLKFGEHKKLSLSLENAIPLSNENKDGEKGETNAYNKQIFMNTLEKV